MANDNSIEKTLKNVELFLKQEAELFGDETFISNQQSAVSPAKAGFLRDYQQPEKEVEKIIVKKDKKLSGFGFSQQTEFGKEKDVEKKPKTIRVSEDHGLFDSAVLKPEWKIDLHWYESDSLNELDSKISGCLKCALGSTRKNFVFGVGNPNTKLVLIGEAPGADEDEQGEPFVGRAGQLLNKILAAVQLRREDVYICNILKCRPPNNRDPLPEEVKACEPFLKKQLEIIRPKLILCLGRIAAQTLLKTNATLTELRNNVYEYEGIKVLVTFHPAALLRNPNWKRPAWEDVQKMRKMYDELS